jgi:magnesium transporter
MPKGCKDMDNKHILQDIRDNIQSVINRDSPLGSSLWDTLLGMHPADIADFLPTLDSKSMQQIFNEMPKHSKLNVFRELSDTMKVSFLAFMPDQDRIDVLESLPTDELTDLFDLFSDEELKRYLGLLHKSSREKVLSLLKFDPESAGGIMDVDVLTLMEDFTVAKSIQLLQRLRPYQEIQRQIYITNRRHSLVGYINLEDLVLHNPTDRISTFMHDNKLVVQADQDRELASKDMIHYGLMSVPVVDQNNHFLGAITSDTLVDVVIEEASEDIQKMSALAPMKYPYFETSFFRILWERSYILIALLLAESFSSVILDAYELTLSPLLYSLIPMLISTGGNTSNQTSAIVIQGMATGEINKSNMARFLQRELLMAGMMALILGVTAFTRIFFFTEATTLEGITVSCALGLLVMLAVTLGSCIPFVLRRFNIDPAFSAGPFLATVLDIIGVLTYCYIVKWLLF